MGLGLIVYEKDGREVERRLALPDRLRRGEILRVKAEDGTWDVLYVRWLGHTHVEETWMPTAFCRLAVLSEPEELPDSNRAPTEGQLT